MAFTVWQACFYGLAWQEDSKHVIKTSLPLISRSQNATQLHAAGLIPVARTIADIANAELQRLAGGLVMAERNVHERGRGGRGPGRRPGGHLELLLTLLECQHGIVGACVSLSDLGNEPSIMLRDEMPQPGTGLVWKVYVEQGVLLYMGFGPELCFH